MSVIRILLLKLYLKVGLVITAIHTTLEYQSSRSFHWFPEEVSSARRNGDNDPNLKVHMHRNF